MVYELMSRINSSKNVEIKYSRTGYFECVVTSTTESDYRLHCRDRGGIYFPSVMSNG